MSFYRTVEKLKRKYLYTESLNLDNFEVLAVEEAKKPYIDTIFGMVVVFKYRNIRHLLLTASAKTVDWNAKPPKETMHYNNQGIVYMLKNDIPDYEKIERWQHVDGFPVARNRVRWPSDDDIEITEPGQKLLPISVKSLPDHLKTLFDEDDPKFIGLVEYAGNKKFTDMVFYKPKSRFLRDNFLSSLFLTYLSDFIKKYLSDKKSIDSIMSRVGLSNAVSDNVRRKVDALYS